MEPEMKINIKFVVYTLVVMPFVVVAVMAFYLNYQNSLAGYELGPVVDSELNFIKGESGEGIDCYTTKIVGCDPSLDSKDTCTVFSSSPPTCTPLGKKYGVYPKYAYRAKGQYDHHNTLIRSPVLEKCFDYVMYVSTMHTGTTMGGGWHCDTATGCKQSFFNLSTNNCTDCKLSLKTSVPGPGVESAKCGDP
jgi:hypothetical protein